MPKSSHRPRSRAARRPAPPPEPRPPDADADAGGEATRVVDALREALERVDRELETVRRARRRN